MARMITTIPIGTSERLSGRASDGTCAQALECLRRDGAVVLADALDPTPVVRLRDRMLADLVALRERVDAPYNWNQGNIQHPPPMDADWLIRDILVNELAIQVTQALLGKPVLGLYTGNTAMAGSTCRQPVHTDFGHLWPASCGLAPAQGVILNLPLVDMDDRNGATELWLGSHRDPHMQEGGPNEVPTDLIERRRLTDPPVRACAQAGSILLRDVRLWHAGMPNPSSSPRPMVAMAHWCSWYQGAGELVLPLGAESVLGHPVLGLRARYVDGPIDHLGAGQAFAYAPGTVT